MTRPLLLAIFGAVACSGGGAESTLGGDVVSLVVEPADQTVEVRSGESVSIAFTAIATFKDGREEEIDLVSWSSSNLSAGDIGSDGVFTSTDTNGGVTEITARHLEVEAASTITVVYREDILDEDVDPALPDAFEDVTSSVAPGLELSYPPDGVTVPRNLEGLGFGWELPEGANITRLRLQSDITDVSVYSTDDQWLASADLWATVAAANRGGTVKVNLQTGVWDGSSLSDVQTGPAQELTVNRLDARGSVLYWASSREAIMRIPFGETSAEAFWTREDSDGRCTGCHVVSNEVDLMVVSHDGIDGRFTMVDIQDPDDLQITIQPTNEARVTFKTLEPSGTRILGSNLSELFLYDGVTGELLDTYTDDLPLAMPDWSPDGDYVVAIRATGLWNNDFFFEGGELIRIPWDGDELGEPEVLLPADATYNYFYPAYSPDGEWIAFNRAPGAPYANVDAELMLIHESGGEPILLAEANGAEGNQNSYPRWGPLPDDDVLWLAYSSLRSYELDPSNLPQVWVTAIDTTLAEQGVDASSPPFWLPGQDTGSDNHLPFWWRQ